MKTPSALASTFLATLLATTPAFVRAQAEKQATPPADAAAPAPGRGPGGPGGFGGPGGPGGTPPAEVKLLKQFDKDGDKLLNAAERKAAREHIAANPPARRGFGGRGGRGGNQEPPQAGVPLTAADVKTYGKEGVYDTSTLRTLFFTFEDADWEKQMEEFNNTDIELPATVVVDGKTYKDVGVHFRGASSYFTVGTGFKRSLAVSFDAKHEDQNFLGAHTLNLLNSHGDASFLRAPLYSLISQDYLAAPRVNFVRVVINGENWGVYSSAEQFNKDFTKDRFKTTRGARWKVPGSPNGRGSLAYLGDSPDAYRRIYEIKSKDDPKSWALLARLCKVLNETPADRLEAELKPLLDIDSALKFLALDVVFSNGDGYWTRTSDYTIAEDDKGRLHIVPHDMNETFSFGGGPGGGRGGPGGRGPGGPGGPGGFGPPPGAPGAPTPPPTAGEAPKSDGNATAVANAGAPRGPGGPAVPGGFGGPGGGPGRGGGVNLDPLVAANNPDRPLAAKLLAVPALRERYLGYVRDLATNWLDWSKLGPVAQRYHDLIDADVKRDTRKLESYEAFATSLDDSPRSLKTFAAQRRAYLLGLDVIKALPEKK